MINENNSRKSIFGSIDVLIKPLIFFIMILGMNWQVYAKSETELTKVTLAEAEEILLRLSNIARDNFDKINTWEGAFAFEKSLYKYDDNAIKLLERYMEKKDIIGTPKAIKKVHEGTVLFKLDPKNDKLYTSLERPKSIWLQDIDSGQVYETKTGSFEEIMIKIPSYTIQSYDCKKTLDDIVLERMADKNKRSQFSGYGIDPRESFNVAYPIWELLSMFSQSSLKDGYGAEIVAIKEGISSKLGFVYKMELAYFTPQEKAGYVMLFPENSGFNVADVTLYKDEKIFSQIITEYKEIAGVGAYVPYVVHIMAYDSKGEKLRSETKRTFSITRINEPIPAETFSDENCGLREGDILVDHTDNEKRFVLKDGKFVEFEEKKE